ncbi:hypothetical protein A2U01_0098810 [Trifolium medium]|nr:hypothetical protein [Trifolium medium]
MELCGNATVRLSALGTRSSVTVAADLRQQDAHCSSMRA